MRYKVENIHVLTNLATCTYNMALGHSQEQYLCFSPTLGIFCPFCGTITYCDGYYYMST